MTPEEQSLQKELEALSPMLAQLRDQDDGFGVPPGYFDQSAAEIFRRVAEVPEARSTHLWLPRQLIAMAAAILIAVAAGIWWYNSISISGESNTMFTSLSEAEITHYLEENLHHLDPDWMLELDIGLSDAEWLPGSMSEGEEAELLEYLIEDIEQFDLENLF